MSRKLFVILVVAVLAAMGQQKLFAQVRAGGSCGVQMEDSLNRFKTVLKVSVEPSGAYRIVNQQSFTSTQSVEVVVRGSDVSIETSAGVPHFTPMQIAARYGEAVANLRAKGAYSARAGQLKWTLEPNSLCQGLDLELVMFLVDEWFYYG